jgi:hypothetical protein
MQFNSYDEVVRLRAGCLAGEESCCFVRLERQR